MSLICLRIASEFMPLPSSLRWVEKRSRTPTGLVCSSPKRVTLAETPTLAETLFSSATVGVV